MSLPLIDTSFLTKRFALAHDAKTYHKFVSLWKKHVSLSTYQDLDEVLEAVEAEIDKNHIIFEDTAALETALSLLGLDQTEIDVAINHLQLQTNEYDGNLKEWRPDIRIDKPDTVSFPTFRIGFRTALYNDVVSTKTFARHAYSLPQSIMTLG